MAKTNRRECFPTSLCKTLSQYSPKNSTTNLSALSFILCVIMFLELFTHKVLTGLLSIVYGYDSSLDIMFA